jgi:type I restriction enzyme S subunit
MFRKETEFQETEIGDFPKDWEVRRLNEITELQRGLSYSGREKSRDEIPDGYLFLTLNSIKEGGGLKENGWTWIKSNKLKERHFVKEGDLVIANTEQSKDGSLIGSPAIVHFPEWYKKDKAVFSHHISKLLLRISNVDVNFLFYYLSFVQPLARKYHTGTGVWGLNVDSWARDLLIPLPPLDEQKRIAGVLSMIDGGIESVDRAIAKLERMKKALLNELLTGRIRVREESGKLTFYKEIEFQETEIGEIPKDWKIEKLSSLATIIMGQSPPSSTYNKEGRGLPFIQGKMEFGKMYPSPTMYTSRPLKIAEKGDILISVRAPVGDVNITPYKLCIGRGLAAIRFNSKTANNLFYFYYLQSIKSRLESLGKGSTFKAITKKDLEELRIVYPPLNEQKGIASILLTIDNAIELYYREKEMLLRLRRGLMGVLLTGRVRVVSDVRDVEVNV